jgi:uncharacterized protein YxeA
VKKILALLTLFVATTSFAWTVSWQPVTTYTDNSLIEAAKMPVKYEIKKDGVVLVTGTTATSHAFVDTGHGLTRSFTAKAVLQTGEASVESPAYSWTVPLGEPRNPAGLQVAP